MREGIARLEDELNGLLAGGLGRRSSERPLGFGGCIALGFDLRYKVLCERDLFAHG